MLKFHVVSHHNWVGDGLAFVVSVQLVTEKVNRVFLSSDLRGLSAFRPFGYYDQSPS